MAKGTYDIGIAFDGDGDRILIVGKSGKVLDGDDLLYLLTSASSHRSEDFQEKGVVGTLMTNKALDCLLYTSPSPRDGLLSRMPSSA